MTGRRRFWVWRVVCWAVIILAVAARIRGFFAFDQMMYVTGRLIAPATAPSDSTRPLWWSFPVRIFSIAQNAGTLILGYTFYNSAGPDPQPLSKQWTPSLGFRFYSYPGPARMWNPWFAWSWPEQMMVLGAGTRVGTLGGSTERAIMIPLWMIAGFAATPLLISWRRQRRLRSRLSQGRCIHCGYNRAGLAPQHPCPECGRQGNTTTPTATP